MGGTMRLGADPVKLHEDTRARELYGEAVIYERHRHRYEVNNSPAQAARGRRPGGLRHVAGRAPGRDRRAATTTRSSSPRSSTRSSSRGPQRPAPLFREFVGAALSARARARRPREEISAQQPAPQHVRPRVRGREGRRLDGALRRAVRDPEPVRARARVRGPRDSPSCSGSGGERGEPTRRGNLLARIAGRDERSVLLCAHLDTVRRQPRRSSRCCVDGGWENAQRGDPRRRQQGRASR